MTIRLDRHPPRSSPHALGGEGASDGAFDRGDLGHFLPSGSAEDANVALFPDEQAPTAGNITDADDAGRSEQVVLVGVGAEEAGVKLAQGRAGVAVPARTRGAARGRSLAKGEFELLLSALVTEEIRAGGFALDEDDVEAVDARLALEYDAAGIGAAPDAGRGDIDDTQPGDDDFLGDGGVSGSPKPATGDSLQ